MKRQLWCMAVLCLLLLAGCDGGSSSGLAGIGGPSAPVQLYIATTALPVASLNVGYNASVTALGGSGAGYQWSIVAGSLPPGLALAPNGTPDTTLTGTPTTTGAYSFTLQVTDDLGATAQRAFSLGIAGPALVLAPANFGSATIGTTYAETLTASGGAAVYQWQISAGSLPPGLSLGATGTPATTISGTPTAIGIYAFSVTVGDGFSPSATQQFSITVDYPGGTADSWSAPGTNAPYFTRGETVWTGSKLLHWGGYVIGATGQTLSTWTPINTGSVYDPYADTTTAMAACPLVARVDFSLVWCGDRMIVWGGDDWSISAGVPCNDGAAYDPVTDTWTMLPAGPTGRFGHSAVWTGTEMIVWGGYQNATGLLLASGAAYKPATNSWRSLPATGAPSARAHQSAFFVNGRMVIWGGRVSATSSNYVNSGGVYDVAANAWSSINMTGFPPMDEASYIVQPVGDTLYIWTYGGTVNGNHVEQWFGAGYDISADMWTDLSSTPPATTNLREQAQCCSTGSKLIMWCGWDDTRTWLDEGQIFDPATGQWSAMSTAGSPSPGGRILFWTGNRMLAWGGASSTQSYRDVSFYTP